MSTTELPGEQQDQQTSERTFAAPATADAASTTAASATADAASTTADAASTTANAASTTAASATAATDAADVADQPRLWRLGVIIALVALLWRAAGTGAVAMLFAFVVLIVCHELGHYLAARRAGMKVTEFFVGFGPKVWSTRRGETDYGIKMIPAGAYVKIIGMNNLETVDPADEDRTYRHGKYLDRLSVVLAGPVVNLALGFLGLVVLYLGWGFVGIDALVDGPDPENWSVGKVVATDDVGEPTAAAELGLQPGDHIVAVDGQSVDTWSEVVDNVSALPPGTEVEMTVARDDEVFDVNGALGTRIDDDGTKHGFLGVSVAFAQPVGFGTAIVESADDYGSLVDQSLMGIAALFKPSTWESLLGFDGGAESTATTSGPASASVDSQGDAPQFMGAVGIIDGARGALHIEFLIVLWVMINVFVGLFNLIPLLPFDGGHVAVATFEEIRARISGDRNYRVDYARLVPVTFMVVAALVFFFVVVTSRDVMRIVERVN